MSRCTAGSCNRWPLTLATLTRIRELVAAGLHQSQLRDPLAEANHLLAQDQPQLLPEEDMMFTSYPPQKGPEPFLLTTVIQKHIILLVYPHKTVITD